MASLKTNNVYTLLPMTAIPHMTQGYRQSMSLQSQGRKLAQGTRCCTRVGAIALALMRQDVCLRLQAPEHPHGAGERERRNTIWSADS